MENLKHLAIIMDGNGRYAKSLGKLRTQGHLQGADNIRTIAIAANKHNIEVMTLYAFSTENWTRPEDEVNYLMKLPGYFINKFLDELMSNNIKIAMIGEKDRLPQETKDVLEKAIETTKNNTGLILNFAVNYGFKREMVLAIQNIVKDNINYNDINDKLVDKYLMTKEFPPVDLLIRTSGEQRISNFLMWQIAYSELIFTDVPWPIFNEEELDKCIEEYYNRNRRYGGLK